MKNYDVEPTAEVIDAMVKDLQARAERISELGSKLRKTRNFEYVSEVIQEVVNASSNLRLDLLVTRPLRETMK